MKKSLLTVLILSSLATPVLAEVQSGPYLTARVGTSSMTDDSISGTNTDSVFTPSIAFGYRFGCPGNVCGRVDLNYNYFGEYKDKIRNMDYSIKAHTVLMNGYLDLYPTEDIFFYATAGVGISSVKRELRYNLGYLSDTDCSAAYQLGLGFGYNVTENFTLDIGYRYNIIALVENKYDKDDKKAIQAHNFALGFTYTF